MSEINDSGGNFCNCCVLETGMSAMGDKLMYAFPSEVSESDLVIKKSSLSGDTESHGLIN